MIPFVYFLAGAGFVATMVGAGFSREADYVSAGAGWVAVCGSVGAIWTILSDHWERKAFVTASKNPFAPEKFAAMAAHIARSRATSRALHVVMLGLLSSIMQAFAPWIFQASLSLSRSIARVVQCGDCLLINISNNPWS